MRSGTPVLITGKAAIEERYPTSAPRGAVGAVPPAQRGEPDDRRHRAVVPGGADDRRRRSWSSSRSSRTAAPRRSSGSRRRPRRPGAPNGWRSSRTPPPSCPAASTTARPSRRWRPWWSRRSRTGAPSTSSRTTACSAVAVAHVDPEKVQLARSWRSATPATRTRPGAPGTCCAAARASSSRRSPTRCWSPVPGTRSTCGSPSTSSCAAPSWCRSIAHERVLGVMTWVAAESGRHYAEDDLAFAEDVARGPRSPSTTPSCTARLAAAVRLQQAVLPDAHAGLPGWDVASYYDPSGAPTSAATSTTRSAWSTGGWCCSSAT